MFGTVLHDVFGSTERRDIQVALEDLCSPLNPYGWASVGLYAFFDPVSESRTPPGSRLLYIGLAKDLPERFAQHTGLISFPEQGCKRALINDWFQSRPQLGVSFLVQSTLAQVDTHRERDRHRRAAHDEELTDGLVSNPPEGLASAVLLEGQCIETFRLLHGSLPRWNKVGASKAGAERAAAGSAAGVLALMDGSHDSLFRARRTLRELSQDETAAAHEFGPLHVARSETILAAVDRAAADQDIVETMIRLAMSPHYERIGFTWQVNEMLASGYLDGVPGMP